MSGKSLTFMRNLMGEIFKDAVEDGLIEKDPTSSRRLVIPSNKVTKRFRWLTSKTSCPIFMNCRMKSDACLPC